MDSSYQPRVTRLSLQELEDETERFNAAVHATPEIDRFCSSTYWSVSAHLAFALYRPVWIRSCDAGYAAMAIGYRLSHGMVLEPLESVWGAASPLVGSDPSALVEALVPELMAVHRNHIPIILTGLPNGGLLQRAVYSQFCTRMQILVGPSTRCYRASLEGGMDGFLKRRSGHFRARLRRAQRESQEHGITFEHHSHFETPMALEQLYERLIAIEAKSWKGIHGTGLLEPTMQEFYRHMLTRLWPAKSVRCIIARHEDKDVGFVFGAVMDSIYRGLQASYEECYHVYSLGNVLQAQMIELLVKERCELYDLGVEVPYKERWGEDVFETAVLVLE